MYEIKLENILFLDIETVPASSFDELTERKQALWEVRSARLRKEDESPADIWSKAEVLWEDRSVDVEEQILKDTFAPLQIHAYRLR